LLAVYMIDLFADLHWPWRRF